MIFWLSLALLTLAICAVAFYPLLKKSVKTDDTARDNLNKAFYFDRLKEVENEVREGVIDDAEQTKRELQQSLLDDIPAQAEPPKVAQKTYGKVWFVTVVLLVAAISSGVYFSVGSWQANTMLTASHNKLDYFYDRIKNEQNQPLSEQEMNQFAMALRVELQKNPQDDKTWFMLGQLGMATDNGQLALDSFKKAVELQPNSVQYKVSLAQILMFSEDNADKTQGEALLSDVLRTDHTNLEALSLLAFRAFEQEDYQKAGNTWKMMLKLMPPEDPRYKTLERSIKMAESMASQPTKQ